MPHQIQHISLLRAFDTGFQIYTNKTEDTFLKSMKVAFAARQAWNQAATAGVTEEDLADCLNLNQSEEN